ncbi:hypothetical protein Tco_1186009 [Tanacetum coccineum]
MVAYLERTDGNADFHEIVDFLTTSPIHYALTVSPTIYASYIEQFWNTTHSQTVNDVKQIHATVDGKTVVISESSVRSDLYFNDEDGITCLTNETIFENLALMGQMTDGKGLPLCLLALEAAQASGDRPRCQRKPLGVIALIALSQKVEGLESDLKKTKKLRRLTLVTSEDEEDLVAEDPSKQGRSLIEEMDLDAGISLVPPHVEVQGRYGQNLETQEGFGDGQEVSTVAQRPLMEIRKSDAKDKGKAKMDETESPRKMKQRERAQISRDEEGFIDVEWDDVLARVAADEDFLEGSEMKRASQEVFRKACCKINIREASEGIGNIRVGNHTEAYQIFADMLKKFNRDDLVKLWDLVKERYMHDPLVWSAYDTCGVHHVSSVRGHDIFMLVEKEYPLTRGTLGLMMVARLLVEADSEMSR